jgi:hypothetical protein
MSKHLGVSMDAVCGCITIAPQPAQLDARALREQRYSSGPGRASDLPQMVRCRATGAGPRVKPIRRSMVAAWWVVHDDNGWMPPMNGSSGCCPTARHRRPAKHRQRQKTP